MNKASIQELNECFNQEIKEYLGIYEQNDEEDEQYIDKEFKKAEKEDPPEETNFKHMQEIFNTNFNSFNGMTKSIYAAEIEAIDLNN